MSTEGTATTVVEGKILSSHLLEYFRSIDSVVSEIVVEASDRGLHAEATDPANVGLVSASLRAGAFGEFRTEDVEFGVYVDEIIEALESLEPRQVTLRFEAEPSRELFLESGPKTFRMSCMDPDNLRSRPDVPDIDLPAVVHISSDVLEEIVNGADRVSDHLRLVVDPDIPRLSATAEGDTGAFTAEYERKHGVEIEPGSADSKFSLMYLKDIVQSIPEDVTVTLDLGEEYPCALTSPLASQFGEVRFMVSPRVGSVDE